MPPRPSSGPTRKRPIVVPDSGPDGEPAPGMRRAYLTTRQSRDRFAVGRLSALLRAKHRERVDPRRVANRDKHRDYRATRENRDRAAERDRIERRHVVEQAAKQLHDDRDSEPPGSQPAGHPPGALTQHQSGDGAWT